MNSIKIIKLTLLVSSLLLPVSAFSDNSKTPEQIFKDVSMRSEKARKLPKSNTVVLFGNDGDAVVVLDNPRWVIKGQLYDMFQNKAIADNKELSIAENKIPLNTLKVDTVNVLSFTVNPSKTKELIVFIDPFVGDSANDIEVNSVAAKHYRIRFILTPMAQASVEKLFKFSCVIKGESPPTILNRIRFNKYGNSKKLCSQDLVGKSYGLSAFLRLQKSPTLIASNNTASEGLPRSIVAFLAKNME